MRADGGKRCHRTSADEGRPDMAGMDKDFFARALADTLAVYDVFEVKQGVWPTALRIEDLFEYRFYDAVVQRHPELAD